RRRYRLTVMVGLVLLGVSAAGAQTPRTVTDEPYSVPAAFAQRSYAPGDRASLAVWGRRPSLVGRFYRVGLGAGRVRGSDVMVGTPDGKSMRLRGTNAHLTIPRGPSGLYFLRLGAPGGWLGFAPFVLRSRQPGANRVAVVLPTNTWQAYNFRDVNGDG